MLRLHRIRDTDLMVIPLPLGPDNRYGKFFIQFRNRQIKAVDFLFRPVCIFHLFHHRLQEFCSLCSRLLRTSCKEVHDILRRKRNMNGHLALLHGKSPLSLLCLVHMEHIAVCIEIGKIGAVL